jgi:hypothetical protein
MRAAVEKRGSKVPVPARSKPEVHSLEPVGSEVEPEAPVEGRPALVRRRKVTSRPAGALSGRLMRVQLTAEQERWLMDVVGDALKSGQRVSEAAIVRLAVERLRQQGGWVDVRDNLR